MPRVGQTPSPPREWHRPPSPQLPGHCCRRHPGLRFRPTGPAPTFRALSARAISRTFATPSLFSMMNHGTRFPSGPTARCLTAPYSLGRTAPSSGRPPMPQNHECPRVRSLKLQVPAGTAWRARRSMPARRSLCGKDHPVNPGVENVLHHPRIGFEFTAIRRDSCDDGLGCLDLAGIGDRPGSSRNCIYVWCWVTSNGLCSRSYMTRSMLPSQRWVIASLGALPAPAKLTKPPKTTLPSSSRLTSWVAGSFRGRDWPCVTSAGAVPTARSTVHRDSQHSRRKKSVRASHTPLGLHLSRWA